MKKLLTFENTLLVLLLATSILSFFCIRENNRLHHQLKTQRPQIIIHAVDNAGASIVGKVTDKEIIEGHYTVTVGSYGKFLVTKEQYEAIKVGDPIPEYLKGRKQ